MTAIEASTTRRAALVLVLVVVSATGLWFAIDRATRTDLEVEAATTPFAQARAESETGMNGAVDEPRSNRASVGSDHSNVAAIPGVTAARPVSVSAPVESARIRGRAVEAWGEPIADLPVWLVPAGVEGTRRYLVTSEQPSGEVMTSVRGEFEFVDIAPGAWLIGPAPARAVPSIPDDRGVAPMAMVVEVRAGEDAKEIEIRVQRGLMIRGRVLQPDGTPAFSGVVSARSQESPGLCLAPTHNDGTFTLGPLVGGQYELWADGDYEGTASSAVLAFAGDTDVALQLRAGGSLSGRVIDGRADGASEVMLVAMRQDIEPRAMLGTSADTHGRFRFENVAPGSYQVVAHTEDAWFAVRSEVEVASGRATEDLVLELIQGGRLRLQHAGRDVVNVQVRKDDVRILSNQIAELDSSIAVPSGRITVRWSIGSRPPIDQRIEIVPGSEMQLVLPD